MLYPSPSLTSIIGDVDPTVVAVDKMKRIIRVYPQGMMVGVGSG